MVCRLTHSCTLLKPLNGLTHCVTLGSLTPKGREIWELNAPARGTGTVGSNDPPEIYLGGQTWYFDQPDFFGKNIFWYTPTRCYWGYIIIILYSETRSRTVFFVIISNRFVDSSKCGPHDFDPPQSKNSSHAPGPSQSLHLSAYDSPGGSSDQRFHILLNLLGSLVLDQWCTKSNLRTVFIWSVQEKNNKTQNWMLYYFCLAVTYSCSHQTHLLDIVFNFNSIFRPHAHLFHKNSDEWLMDVADKSSLTWFRVASRSHLVDLGWKICAHCSRLLNSSAFFLAQSAFSLFFSFINFHYHSKVMYTVTSSIDNSSKWKIKKNLKKNLYTTYISIPKTARQTPINIYISAHVCSSSVSS